MNANVVCFIGSPRFLTVMDILQLQREQLGHVVLRPSLLDVIGDVDDQVTDLGAQLEELHRHRIEMADEVFLVNFGGFVGARAARELEYAIALGKRVTYLETRDAPVELAPSLPLPELVRSPHGDARLESVTVYRMPGGSLVALCDPCARKILAGYPSREIAQVRVSARCLYAGWSHA